MELYKYKRKRANVALIKGNINSVNNYLAFETNIPVNVFDKTSVKKEHVDKLKELLNYLSISSIYTDLRKNKKLVIICSISDELKAAFEKIVFTKVNRYKQYILLVLYAENFICSDKRDILKILFTAPKTFRVDLAISRLHGNPDFQKYFNVS